MIGETRVHIHLLVSDLPASRDFYERFLGVCPVKEKPGYVKFLPDFAPLNLALSESGERSWRGSVSHIGIEVATSLTVRRQLERVRTAALPARVETGVDCCHANQDKFWVRDPDGLEWEVYHLNHDIEDARAVAVTKTAGENAASGRCCAGEWRLTVLDDSQNAPPRTTRRATRRARTL